MTNFKSAKLVTATVILALGFSAQAAQAKGGSQDGRDLLIVNNGDGSDFFEFGIRKLFRYLALRE